MSTTLLANSIGYLALFVMVVGLVRKDGRHLLLLISGGVVLWAIHYGLLGSISGAIVHGIAAVGVFLAHITYSSSIHLRISLMVICSLAGVVASLYSGVNAPNIAASVGCVVMTSSQYVLRGARMRQGFLAGEAVFFVFAVLVGSIPGMLVTITNSFAGLIGLFRSRHLEAQQATTATY